MAPNHPASTLYLVDGTSQLYRAYFALGGLSNADGLPTNAVFGFTTMLRKLIKEQQPPYLGVAFDPHMYATLTPAAVIDSVAVMMIVVLVASLYPLFRAARISPVDAIGRGR